jgi:glutamine amidotransferase
MSAVVTIVDYGSGNLLSVARAFERCGAAVTVSSDPASIEKAERLVLPGVGAFADGIAGLRSRGLVEPVLSHAGSGRPLLGICLGMQMLAGASEEFGLHDGLGLVPGRVVRVPSQSTTGERLKIPHIGWSELVPAPNAEWRGSMLDDTPPNKAIYLVHSFHLVPDDPRDLLAQCLYGGHALTAAVRRNAVMGCQFHPEKSAEAGLRILARFLKL